MKKLLALFVTAILALTLSACGGNKSGNDIMSSDGNKQNQSGNSITSDLTPSVSSDMGQGSQTSGITRERALEIALEAAGAKQEDIRDLKIELDDEHGTKVWEVDFDYGNKEYSYDINYTTGAITKVEHENDR